MEGQIYRQDQASLEEGDICAERQLESRGLRLIRSCAKYDIYYGGSHGCVAEKIDEQRLRIHMVFTIEKIYSR